MLDLPVPKDGAATATVPGAVSAWAEASNRFGRLELRASLAPAVEIAREGFPIGERLLEMIAAHRHRLDRGARGWQLLDDLEPGATVVQPSLAALLEHIGRDGPAAFYEGEIAEAITRTIVREGGTLTAGELNEHRTIVRSPLRTNYHGAEVVLQPPVSQAILLSGALSSLETRNGSDHLRRTHLSVEAIEAAFAYRDEIASPGAEKRLLEVELEIDGERAHRRGGPKGSAHTAAVTAADSDGTLVSMLVSVFDDFGCATLVPEGEFLLNDRMLGFSPDPSSPNAAHPEQRPVHTLSPILVEDGQSSLALATSGADGQVQTLLQIVTALLDNGLDVQEALGMPRWRSVEAQLFLENYLSEDLKCGLRFLGHDVQEMPYGHHMFGAAAAAGIDHESGNLFAATDPRREVWAAGW